MSKIKFFIIFISIFLVNSENIFAQTTKTGFWNTHYCYNEISSIATTPDKIYALTVNGLLIYDKNFDSYTNFTTIQGLTSVGLTAIAYDKFSDNIIIGYEDGNIDFLHEDFVFNLSDIKRSNVQGSKRINRLVGLANGLVYACCDFGVVVIDVPRYEIKESYILGKNYSPLITYDISICDTVIYAATAKGLLYADARSNILADFSQWKQVSPISDSTKTFKFVSTFDNSVFACLDDENLKDSIWKLSNGNWTLFSENQSNYLATSHGKLLHISRDTADEHYTIRVFDKIDDFAVFGDSVYEQVFTNLHTANLDYDGNLWVSDNASAMFKMHDDFSKMEDMQQFRPYTYPGPGSNTLFSLNCSKDKLYCSRGRIEYFGPGFVNFDVDIFENKQWRISSVLWNWSAYPPQIFSDVLQTVENPLNPDEYYAATWMRGLVKVNSRTGEYSYYDETNSSLQWIRTSDSTWYAIRTGGLAFDRNNTLWVSNSLVSNTVSRMTAAGDWKGFNMEYLLPTDMNVKEICVDYYSQAWVRVQEGGMLIVREKGNSYEALSVDVNRGNNYNTSKINFIAEDKKGFIWIGTDKGVKVNYHSLLIFDNPIGNTSSTEFETIIHDGRPLLENDNVTSIAIDGADRKWLGTSNNGVYLVSADGKTKIHQFNTVNSPLNSNTIISLAISPTTGEVFILTDKGLMSYMSDASEGNQEQDNVVVYPNPVKSSFEGYVTIRGLAENSAVKIVDEAGRLLAEATSNGGTAVWNCLDLQGRRVKYGVYFAFITQKTGKAKIVKKIVFTK